MAKVNLSAPWIIYYREIEAMFRGDPGVRVIFDEDALTVKLYVDDSGKAYALDELIPPSKKFGRTVLKIGIIPANDSFTAVDKASLLDAALQGNSALSFIRTISGIMTNPLTYVVFKKDVVQYWTDDLGDYFGVHSTLFQDIAKDVFENATGVFFCTDTAENGFFDGERVGAPLGEWP